MENKVILDLFEVDCEEVPLPPEVAAYVAAFERGEELTTIEFELELLCTPFTEEMLTIIARSPHLELI